MSQPRYTLGQLADLLGVTYVGNPQAVIIGLATLMSARTGHLSFLANVKYVSALKSTQASAVIVTPDKVADSPCHCLVCDDPYLTYARASHLFEQRDASSGTIHPAAVISDTATIAPGVTIGANCYIGEQVSIGKNTRIGAGCTIGDRSEIGEHCLLHANVTVYHQVSIGNQTIIHSAAIIGSDGFGFARGPQGWIKIAQLGGVRIGDSVEIGAGTTIDRGALDDTVIGDNVIIDNQVIIAHNVHIGERTAIAGGAGIAGSTQIGKRCTIAGGVGIIGHLTIADDVHITVCSLITQSITSAGSWSSGTPMQKTREWRKNAVRFAKLDAMHRRIKALEKQST